MEKLKNYLGLINELITKFNLEKLKTISPLESNKTEIFFLGLPKSGKTTFLNAILGLERNEFYESAKKATKCIFKISYGNNYSYKRKDDTTKLMPKTIEARRDLIKYLNENDNLVEIFIPINFLQKINIYDFPGLFSGDKTDKNIEFSVQSSDLIILFKNASDMLTPEEYNLLLLAKDYGSKYLLLFTFEDLLDKKLRNNKIELENYYAEKIKEYPEEPIYFSISSEEYFKNKKGNINNFINYIIDNSEVFKNISIKEKIRISAKNYLNSLNTRLDNARNIINEEKEKLIIKYEVEISRKSLELKDNLKDYEYYTNDLNEQMIFEFNKELDSHIKTHNSLETIWKKYLDLLNKKFTNTINSSELNELFSLLGYNEPPSLPEYDEIILKPYDISEIIKKIKKILRLDDNSAEMEKLNVYLNKSSRKKRRSDTEEDEKLFDKLLEILKKINLPKLMDEVSGYIRYIKEIKRFLHRCESVFDDLISISVSKIEQHNNLKLNDLNEKKEKELKEIEKKLLEKYNIIQINDYISKLKEYVIE